MAQKKAAGAVILIGLLAVALLILAHFFIPFLRSAFWLAGVDHPREYLVLLQNNTELRPTGGFMGSYARVRVSWGKPTLLKVQDIYVPDGQLQGHVDPPWPIERSFGQGWFRLRDSNWDPDFTRSAQTVSWFFQKGGEASADGVVAVNLSLIRSVLQLTGPLTVPDEQSSITSENFYQRAQSAAELGFFPGSIQKQTFLSKVGGVVMEEVSGWGFLKKVQLIPKLLALAQTKQIFVRSMNPEVEHTIQKLGFDGSLHVPATTEDTFSFFETNLGSNKANCCVDRSVKLSLKDIGGIAQHSVTIHFTNNNPATLKNPPLFWGGAYVNYLRFVLPIDATIQSINDGNRELSQTATQSAVLRFNVVDDGRVDVEKRSEQGIQVVGFFVFVDAQTSLDVRLSYTTAKENSRLVIQKQGGIGRIPYTLLDAHGERSFQLDRDTTLPVWYR